MATTTSPWKKLAIVGGLVIAAVLAWLALQNTSAPNVTFIDLQGKKVSIEQLRGRVVMVNFWTTDCKTCIEELPEMIQTYDKFKGQGMEYVAVALQRDPPNYVVNFTETRKLPFTVALDSGGDIAKAFGDVQMTPTTFVIDKNGKIIKQYVGKPDFPALHTLLQKAIAG